MLAAPGWFLRLESDSFCSCCWGPVGDQPRTTRATLDPSAAPACFRARAHDPGSRQSSIHHLAAELATCQPAALCASRRRHVPNPSAPCAGAPTLPDEARCASANTRLASGAAAAPAAARSAQPGCNRVRTAGQDAAAPARSHPRETLRLRASQSPPDVRRTNRPAASLLRISAARSHRAVRRCRHRSCAPVAASAVYRLERRQTRLCSCT